jgi:hypothetical protein
VSLLKATPKARAGYTDSKDITASPFFKDIDFEEIGLDDGFQLNVQSSLEPSALFTEKELEPYSSSIFEDF